MAFPRRYLWIPAVPLTLFTAIGALALNAKFRYIHRDAPDIPFTVTSAGAVVVDYGELAKQPAVQVDSPLHKFGELPPLTEHTHVFTIRNVGGSDLTLADGGTTCKCTTATIDRPVLAPGEECPIRVTFNTGRVRDYLQTAVIVTNDPAHKLLELSISGQVRVRLAAAPKEAVFNRLNPGEEGLSQVFVFSQDWDELRLVSATSSLEGVECESVEALPEDLEAAEAKSGFWLRLHALGPYPAGGFFGKIAVQVAGPEDAIEELEVGFAGSVLRRLGVYCPQLDEVGQLQLGAVPLGESKRFRLVLKVRDPEPEISDAVLEVEPSFIEAKLTRHATVPDVYTIDLEVPKSATVGNYGTVLPGHLRLKSSHPRLESLDLRLQLDVVR